MVYKECLIKVTLNNKLLQFEKNVSFLGEKKNANLVILTHFNFFRNATNFVTLIFVNELLTLHIGYQLLISFCQLITQTP